MKVLRKAILALSAVTLSQCGLIAHAGPPNETIEDFYSDAMMTNEVGSITHYCGGQVVFSGDTSTPYHKTTIAGPC
jgi:hypothetical protein